MKKNIFVNKLYSVLTVLLVTFTSLYIVPYYIYGDQVHYYRVYNGLLGYGLSDGYAFYKANIDSREPGYFLLAWASVNLNIDKIYFVTFFNTCLAYLGYRYLTKIGGHPFVVFTLISFSYYSYVLFFSAERLKFGFIFLLIGLLYSKKKQIFYLLSVVTHAQMIIVFAAAFSLRINKDILGLVVNFRVKKRSLLFILVSFFMAIMIFVFMREHLVSKFESYFEIKGILELLKLSMFFALSYFYGKDKKDVVAFFIPLFLFTLIFGGERVNFLGYFAFLFFSLHYRKGFNFGVLITTLYFIYAGFNFLLNIIKYGNGYYSI